MLANAPGFSAVALLSLGLGLCIAAWTYSEVHGLILRDIPEIANPDLSWTAGTVLVSKYADHQPLYRQAEIYAREGSWSVRHLRIG